MKFEDIVLAHQVISDLGEDRERLVWRMLDLLEGTGEPLTLMERARAREFCRRICDHWGADHPAYLEITAALDALDGPTSRA